MHTGAAAVLTTEGVDALLATLGDLGFDIRGPVERDGAIVIGVIDGVADLPRGVRDVQSPGVYRLEHAGDDALFGWSVGPASWKALAFPPRQTLWHARADSGQIADVPSGDARPLALFGVRPCDLASFGVLDRVLLEGAYPDPHYAGQRSSALVITVECGAPSETCFCTSMGTGPAAEHAYDLALCELGTGRFLARTGSEAGVDLLGRIEHSSAGGAELGERDDVLRRAAASIERRLETDDLPALLARNVSHPRWDEVAQRCLSCGNCTLVCPTCFCSDLTDTTDLTGEVTRTRSWASCFDLDHSYLHGGPVRRTVGSRYRQWLTHKLSTWWDQFGTSGCVGCGRCITWCPVGIDLVEEATAIRASDGEVAPATAGASQS